jgi:signal transduction histidine kinase
MLRAFSKIRHRLILGFFLCFVGVAAFVALSYSYFLNIERNLLFLNSADRILNTILEARRYEKNFFLYNQEADFREALVYLAQVEELVLINRKEIITSMGRETWINLRDLLWEYRRSLSLVHEMNSNAPLNADAKNLLNRQIEDLRDAGKQIIFLGERLVQNERNRIQRILRHYRILFGIFFVSVILTGAFVVILLETKVVRPLHTIEEATRNVAQGNFQPIRWSRTRDEIGSLVESFNTMVVQLQESRQHMIQTEKLSALGTLTSGVAHELNNPLSNISTSCQILMEEVNDRLPDYHKELLSSIEEQVIKARDIVRALLEFSREREFELKPTDLHEIVEDTLKLIKGEIPSHVEIRVEVPQGLVINADKARMEQALLNLIMNGIQAMEDEGVLTLRAFKSENGEVVLEVIDTGVGIPPENLPKIFDPFFTTKDVGRGTGLGLSVTYGIIERHGGRITVKSKVGQGTTFRVHLPAITSLHASPS